MIAKLRSHRPTHATVIAYVALFVALGGTTYAAATIGPNDIKDDAVLSRHVKNNSLLGADIKAGALTGPWHFIADTETPGCKSGEFCVSRGNHPGGGLDQYINVWHTRSKDPNDPYGKVGYYRDRTGVVRLRGLARCNDDAYGPGSVAACYDHGEDQVLKLPPGFRPDHRLVLVTEADYAHQRVDVAKDGTVILFAGANHASDFLSLDPVSFRCGPSGVDGCP